MTVARCLIALSLATLPLSIRADDVPSVTQTQGWQAAPALQSLSFRTSVTLAEPMTTSRGERLEPGEYDLDVIDSGDGRSARVVFYRGGVAVAETAGTARTGGSAAMFCDDRPPSSTGFQDLHRDPKSAGITCSSRPGTKAQFQCDERPPGKEAAIGCNTRPGTKAKFLCDERPPVKAEMLCNGRPPSSTGFQDVHREPGSAAILCSARPGAKAQVLCDDRPPSKDAAIGCNMRKAGSFQCDLREPAKAGIQCSSRAPTASAGIGCNERKAGSLQCGLRAPGKTAGFQCNGRAPAKAVVRDGLVLISAGDGQPVIELTLVPAGY